MSPKILVTSIMIFNLVFSSLAFCQSEAGTVTDIDGNVYQTVKIGNQWWMAENLKVTRYSNGDTISHVTNAGNWAELTTGAYCSYDNSADSSKTYGHLYNWYAVKDQRGLAPEDWHVPSDAEWQTLVYYLGGADVAGGKMKEIGTNYWSSPNTGATNECSFSALPSGSRPNHGNFYGLGKYAFFWSSTEYDRNHAWGRTLFSRSSEVLGLGYHKQGGHSVRCVRD